MERNLIITSFDGFLDDIVHHRDGNLVFSEFLDSADDKLADLLVLGISEFGKCSVCTLIYRDYYFLDIESFTRSVLFDDTDVSGRLKAVTVVTLNSDMFLHRSSRAKLQFLFSRSALGNGRILLILGTS